MKNVFQIRNRIDFMQINKTILGLLFLIITFVGCASGNKAGGKNCGCEARKGMTGY